MYDIDRAMIVQKMQEKYNTTEDLTSLSDHNIPTPDFIRIVTLRYYLVFEENQDVIEVMKKVKKIS
jgi:hypothetical protein